MSVLLLGQTQPLRMSRFSIFKSVCQFDWSAAPNLKSIMHSATWRKGIDAKARAGIIHLEKPQRRAGVVRDRYLDVFRAAAGRKQNR